MELGQLRQVELRQAWQTEDRDFTPWLAEEENLKILGDTISLDLELEAVEENVGPFRADILCKDTQNDSWVLIENQLEKTDHRHLGQLMTYAAGLQAVTIVWVADRFCDEHRAAMDWLNDITADRFRFFALEIELWQIDNSNPAPKFNVISKPNNWSRSISEASQKISSSAKSPLKQKQQKYWATLQDFLTEHKSFIKSQTPRPQHWLVFSIGRTGFHLNTLVNTNENKIGVELYISNDQANEYFTLLEKHKEQIAGIIDEPLEWQDLPGKKSCRIATFKSSNFEQESAWDKDMIWFKTTLEKFDQAFRSKIKNLNIDEVQYSSQAA